MKRLFWGAGLIVLGAAFYFFWKGAREVALLDPGIQSASSGIELISTTTGNVAGTSTAEKKVPEKTYTDIENQKPLPNPPDVIKAVYATAYTGGYEPKINYLINLIHETELNAVVIDIKDYSGYVLYDIGDEKVRKYRARQVVIPKINALIKRFHDEGIYVIARQTVFQDPVLAKMRPDLAVQNRLKLATGTPYSAETIWKDRKNLAWMDPAAKEVWDYNIAIAKDAAARGFDEVNFDYIRFPSDGDLTIMKFPFYGGQGITKRAAIRNFFSYLREHTQGIRISADLFGLATVNNDDLGIGQVIQDAAMYFDYVAPMTYPSHYAPGFLGYKNPGAFPEEVVRYSMEKALAKLDPKLPATSTAILASSSTAPLPSPPPPPNYPAKLRPWLQDFNLGATYDAGKVRGQIRAVDEVLMGSKLYNGWMLWNPSNVYTRGGLAL